MGLEGGKPEGRSLTALFLKPVSYTHLAYVVALCIYQFGRWFTEGTFGVGTVAAIGAVAVFIYLLVRPYKEGSSLNVNVKAKTAS